MWEILANQLLPKGLKSFLKSNKSQDLVTLDPVHTRANFPCREISIWRYFLS